MTNIRSVLESSLYDLVLIQEAWYNEDYRCDNILDTQTRFNSPGSLPQHSLMPPNMEHQVWDASHQVLPIIGSLLSFLFSKNGFLQEAHYVHLWQGIKPISCNFFLQTALVLCCSAGERLLSLKFHILPSDGRLWAKRWRCLRKEFPGSTARTLCQNWSFRKEPLLLRSRIISQLSYSLYFLTVLVWPGQSQSPKEETCFV